MKKNGILLACLLCSQLTYGENLIQVFNQAKDSDPIFQQAIANRLAVHENVPITLSALLPQLNLKTNASITRSDLTPEHSPPAALTSRAYLVSLSLQQSVFDVSKWLHVAIADDQAKEADANLNAALQDLMIRVANQYFTILTDQDTLQYSNASLQAFREQYNQVNQQYKVGLKTITDLYTAQAAYDSANAAYIATKTRLANDKEALRMMTGVKFAAFATLKEPFPLTAPTPLNSEAWVQTALRQNWRVKAAQYAVTQSKNNVRVNYAGHLPTVGLEANVNKQYTSGMPLALAFGVPTQGLKETDKQVAIDLNLPLFAGGRVLSQTRQAAYQLCATQDQLEQVIRSTTTAVRQNYLNILAGISQIKADQQAIKSNQSSLNGMIESYHVGTETLVNVLNQRQHLFQTQTQYAIDRYAFVLHILQLKQAAGTLSLADLQQLNSWLS